MIKAVVFDFDGLILDTETSDYESWRETYQIYGGELPRELWNSNIGAIGLFDPYNHLEEQVGRRLDREKVMAERRRRDEELLAAQVVLPGVEAYLTEAREMGLGIGLASSSKHEWVDPHLSRLGLRDYFDVVRCRDDVGDRGKPDPAVYQAAVDSLGVAAGSAVAFEDSPNGALAAKRAGLFCVAVPNQMTRDLSFDHADLRVASLAMEPLTQLLLRLNGSNGS